MKIYKYEVPNELIEDYAKSIMLLQGDWSREIGEKLEENRRNIHNKIFEYVGCDRSLYTRNARWFNKKLNQTVSELTYKE